MTYRCGDIVVVPFPFTDLSASKRRPALLIQPLGEYGDWLCQPVTSQGAHPASLPLRETDFVDAPLPRPSWIRLNRPTILNDSLMLGRAATLRTEILTDISRAFCTTFGCKQLLV